MTGVVAATAAAVAAAATIAVVVILHLRCCKTACMHSTMLRMMLRKHAAQSLHKSSIAGLPVHIV
jgi:hypothetical protein